MVEKKGWKKIETKTLLMVLIAVAIILAIYFYVSNLEPTPKVYEPDDINSNTRKYIGKTVIVKGYYDGTLGEITKTSDPADSPPLQRLRVDLTNIPVNDTPVEGSQYEITGEIEYNPETVQDPNDVILIAEKVERK